MNTPPKDKTTALETWSQDASLYGKLTYIGPQEKPTRTTIFHAGDAAPEGLFQQFQSPHVDYTNDRIVSPMSFAISHQEQVRILTGLASLSLGKNSPEAAWALVMVQVDGSKFRGDEWLLDHESCKLVVQVLSRSLEEGNKAGKLALSRIPL